MRQLLSVVLVITGLQAQLPVDAKAGQLYDVKWSVDEQGRLGILPNPAAGGSTDVPFLVFDQQQDSFAGSFANIGAIGFATLLLSGPRDLLSATDAGYHFHKLGLGAGAGELARRIAAHPAGATPALLRRAELDRQLAVRLARTAPSDAVQEALTALARDDGADPWLRRAAQEELLGLAGTDQAAGGIDLPPLREILAEAPPSPAVLLIADARRLDPLRGLGALARTTGVHVTRLALEAAGGTASEFVLAGGQHLADLPGELPFEITRRFGHMRIWRTIVAMADPEQAPAPSFWASLEGEFDPERMAAGLRALGADVELKDGRLRTELESTRIDVTRSRIVLSSGIEAPAAGERAATALATQLEDEATVQVLMRLPDAPAMRIAAGLRGPIRLSIGLTTGSADELVRTLASFDRDSLRSMLDSLPGRDAAAELARHLDALRIGHEPGAKTARITWSPENLTAQRLVELCGALFRG